MADRTKKHETKDIVSEYETAMYLFVNNDLGMGKGKIAGQVGHAVQHLMKTLIRFPTPAYIEWDNALSRKIVLKATQKELEELIDKWSKVDMTVVYDAGRTQIPSGSMTVVGFAPKYLRDVPPEWKSFKLL